MALPSRRLLRGVLSFLLVALLPAAPAAAQQRSLFEAPEKVEWKEAELALPAYPSAAGLISFYVSPLATASFFIDEKSLSLGPDGVVRYTLVVRASGGAENVSYEGIRCETAERKLYATGRAGEWARSRSADWRVIEESTLNRQHAVLFKDYFCPPGGVRPSLGQIVESLRHPAGLR